jgi:hypothetical protein
VDVKVRLVVPCLFMGSMYHGQNVCDMQFSSR